MKLFLSVSVWICLAAISAAQSHWSGTCAIEFSGTSTMHGFAGKVKAKPFTLTLNNLAARNGAVARASLGVRSKEMDTAEPKRDKKMRKAMKVEAFPGITADLGELKLADTNPSWEAGLPRPTIIPFTLTLLGNKQKLTGRVSNWRNTGEQISFTVTFPVSLKASGIKPPTVLGVVRVHDRVEVKAHLKLKAR